MVPSGPERLSAPQNMFFDNLTYLKWILEHFGKSDFLSPKCIFQALAALQGKTNAFRGSIQNLTCLTILNLHANKSRGAKNMSISNFLSLHF